MRKFYLLLFLMLCSLTATAASWTSDEINEANTAAAVTTMGQTEREIILYTNLARLYPKKFLENILQAYDYLSDGWVVVNPNSSKYKSLVSTLSSMEPCSALTYDREMRDYALCWAQEMGSKGITGHIREECSEGSFSECCFYGNSNALGIVVKLLIDEDNESLGQRKNLLSRNAQCIGVAGADHIQYSTCYVIDITSRPTADISYYRSQNNSDYVKQTLNNGYAKYNAYLAEQKRQAEYKAEQERLAREEQERAEREEQARIAQAERERQQQLERERQAERERQEAERQREIWRKTPARKKFYSYSGEFFLDLFHFRGTYGVLQEDNYQISTTNPGRFMLSVGSLNIRYKMVGISALDFEFGLGEDGKLPFGWRPTMELYIPLSKSFTLNLHAGVALDIDLKNSSYSISSSYGSFSKDAQWSWLAGMSLYHSGATWIPFKIFAEYRKPFDTYSSPYIAEGIYFGLQFEMGLHF